MAYSALLFFVVVLLLCGNPFQMIHAAQNPSGLSIRLIHRHSPESPLYRANLTDAERMKELVQLSNARVKSLARNRGLGIDNSSSITTSSPHSNKSTEAIYRPPIAAQDFMYYIKVGLGTFDSNPPFKINYLGMDSGSDLIWTQCEGCDSCFHQVYPYFPKSQSKSYKPFTDCKSCPPGSFCKDGNKCMIRQDYADGAAVEALASRETFAFESDYEEYARIINVFFGCGLHMTNFEEDDVPNNTISGVLGMDYGGYSFVTQTQKFLHGRFSYCLQPPTKPPGASPMFLRFGDDILSTEGMLTTPLTKVKNNDNYHLNLQDISVAGIRLEIPPEVFQVKEDGSGGCIIDSGSSMSYLHPEAYKTFTKLVVILMESNPNVRKMAPELGFQLCYERFQEPPQVHLPSVTFHFENAYFYVATEDVWYVGTSEIGSPIFCLQIYENDENQTMLGALQQVNHRIVYDTIKGQLLFKQDNCSMAN